jgi:hypothetical protein
MVSTGSLNRWIQTALSIGLRNKTLSIIAMRVNNRDCSPLLESNELDRPAMSSMARHEN